MEEKKEIEEKMNIYEEKDLIARNGMGMLISNLIILLASIFAFCYSISALVDEKYVIGGIILTVSIVAFIGSIIMLCGLHVINPKEAMVFTLFGEYIGTLRKEGYYWINPFASAIYPDEKKVGAADQAETVKKGKISLKATSLENAKQKVNDELGNPIEISAIVIWKVKNPTQAVFNVENYRSYISTQCDAIIRNVARCYPYDNMDDECTGEKTLRGSSQEVAEIMQKELQEKVNIAGIEILEVRITHLSYAPEIASAMLQRQQAVAVIAARQKIVEGAVSMVDMALNQLSENGIVELDEERKAAMVSNLLVVLCGNKDAQPIVNSGSIY